MRGACELVRVRFNQDSTHDARGLVSLSDLRFPPAGAFLFSGARRGRRRRAPAVAALSPPLEELVSSCDDLSTAMASSLLHLVLGDATSVGGEGHALLVLLLLLLTLVGAPTAIICCSRVRERRRAAGKGSGLFAETAATCVVVCEMIEELVSPFAPPALCGWWQDLAKPGLAGAAESARSRQGDAYAWVAEAAQRWTHSSRVRSVAPGSVAVPMMATIDEDEQEDMHEEG